MEKYFTGISYNNGFTLGEIYDKKITGVGFEYWDENDQFQIGNFTSGKINGWIFYNKIVNDIEQQKLCYIEKGTNSTKFPDLGIKIGNEEDKIPTIIAISFKNWSDIQQSYIQLYDSSNDWLYCRLTNKTTYRYAYYNSKENAIIISEYHGDKKVFAKRIGKNDFAFNFNIPKHDFYTHDFSTKSEFTQGGEYVSTINHMGPYVYWNEKANSFEAGYEYNQQKNGICYHEFKNRVELIHWEDNKMNGLNYKVFKDDGQFECHFWSEGCYQPITIIGWPSGAFEIRNHLYSDTNIYEAIVIDTNCNITYWQEYNSKTKQYVKKISYTFGDEEPKVEYGTSSYDAEPEKIPSIKKKSWRKKVAVKKQTSNDNDDLVSQIQELFRKKLKNK